MHHMEDLEMSRSSTGMESIEDLNDVLTLRVSHLASLKMLVKVISEVDWIIYF